MCILIDSGADGCGVTTDRGKLLHHACWLGLTEVVAALIAHGADVNEMDYSDPDGSFPLGEAARGCHVELVRFLMRKGADKRMTDDRGNNVLDVAGADCKDAVLNIVNPFERS